MSAAEVLGMIARVAWVVGIVLFVVAFFLPAVSVAGTGAGSGPEPGYICAMIAIAATGAVFRTGALDTKDVAGIFTLIPSGWLNPLLLAYLAFLIWPRFVKTRRILAAGVVLCLVSTWAFFAESHMVPLAGHYLWAAGALLIVAGEVVALVPAKNGEGS